jgi:hypothetical protein
VMLLRPDLAIIAIQLHAAGIDLLVPAQHR